MYGRLPTQKAGERHWRCRGSISSGGRAHRFARLAAVDNFSLHVLYTTAPPGIYTSHPINPWSSHRSPFPSKKTHPKGV